MMKTNGYNRFANRTFYLYNAFCHRICVKQSLVLATWASNMYFVSMHHIFLIRTSDLLHVIHLQKDNHNHLVREKMDFVPLSAIVTMTVINRPMK